MAQQKLGQRYLHSRNAPMVTSKTFLSALTKNDLPCHELLFLNFQKELYLLLLHKILTIISTSLLKQSVVTFPEDTRIKSNKQLLEIVKCDSRELTALRRSVFRTQSNIYHGAILQKQLTALRPYAPIWEPCSFAFLKLYPLQLYLPRVTYTYI